jgi:hypothetical protein
MLSGHQHEVFHCALCYLRAHLLGAILQGMLVFVVLEAAHYACQQVCRRTARRRTGSQHKNAALEGTHEAPLALLEERSFPHNNVL